MAKRKKKVENKRILALELYKGFLKAEPDLADQAKAAIEDLKLKAQNGTKILCTVLMIKYC